MNLLVPAALWFAFVATAVVALYLLKIRRERQSVPSLDFWLALAGRTQVRSLFQRLKRWISLALWLLIVGCLVLALANPVLTWGRVKPLSLAVVLDNSASMQTVESEFEGKTRLALARDALRELTTRRPVNDEWLLIEAGRTVRVAAPWTRAGATLLEAVDALTPHAGKTDLGGAVALARQLLEGRERPCIAVISDGAVGEVVKLAAADETIAPWIVGRATDNLGVARLAVRINRATGAHHALVAVVNSGEEDVETRVVFELNGVTHSVEPVTVSASGTWEKTVIFNAPEGGRLRAWIDRPDALAIDNEAFAVLEPLRPATALLVSNPDEAFFFEQALVAMDPLVDIDASRSISPTEYNAHPDAAAGVDLAIFNNWAPPQSPAAQACLFVNAWPADLPIRILGVLPATELTPADRDHPLMRYLNFAAAILPQAREVDLSGPATVLARSSEGAPLLFLIERPEGASLCLAFDVQQSDLPFRNAFPILLRNAVTHFSTEQRAWIRSQYGIGETVEPLRPLPADVHEVRVGRIRPGDDAGVEESTLPVKLGRFAYDRTAAAGPLRFTIGDETAYAAVNLADETESRIAPEKTAADPVERLALTGRLFGTLPWVALAVAAGLLIALEWLTYHYRWTE